MGWECRHVAPSARTCPHPSLPSGPREVPGPTRHSRRHLPTGVAFGGGLAPRANYPDGAAHPRVGPLALGPSPPIYAVHTCSVGTRVDGPMTRSVRPPCVPARHSPAAEDPEGFGGEAPPPVAVAGPGGEARAEKVKGSPNRRSAARRHVAVGGGPADGPRRPLSHVGCPARKEYVSAGPAEGNRPRGACRPVASS